MPVVHTKFLPAQNGFRFINSFDPISKLPFISSLHPSRLVIGLCGGMCYTALDYFYAGQQPPDFQDPAQLNPDLLAHLYERQAESMSPLFLARLVDWLLRDDAYVAYLTRGVEMIRLRTMLDAGYPAVLCLVRTHGLLDTTGNHQVVAEGYEIDQATGQLCISLYDPNHPGQEPVITLPADWQVPGAIQQSTGEPLRGFFVMAYKPEALPAELMG